MVDLVMGTSVHSFDGQTVWKTRSEPYYEVGNFLGGGAAGTVYECEDAESHDHYALKILNPLGFRLIAPALLRKCTVLYKGVVHKDADKEKEKTIGIECVWWLLDAATKQYIAAYYSERQNCLKDLTLTQCIDVWGHDPAGVNDEEGDTEGPGEMVEVISSSSGQRMMVPKVPPKYASFVRRRGRLFREIKNMRKISTHKNVIKLVQVLELNQESKCTIFLVMELANGGELFDRIKIDHGTRESTAKYFFQQLLEGVRHCHEQGVCHRDLKPENLLLQDIGGDVILKIADFGFSARFALAENSVDADDTNREDWKQRNDMNASEAAHSRQQQQQQVMHTSLTPIAPASYLEEYSPMKVLKSVVGSPFYVAPEVLQAKGYDGPRADIWSLGVILYAMLAGNLPFGQELATCKRFRHFCKWVREQEKHSNRFWEKEDLEFPPWLFPANFSVMAKGLIVSMLHPDPNCRLTIKEAMQHPLCAEGEAKDEVEEEEVQMQQAVVSKEGGIDAEGEEKAGIDSMVDMMAVASVNDYSRNADSIDDGVFAMEEDGFEMESDSTGTAMRSGPVSSIDLTAMDSGDMSTGGNTSDSIGASGPHDVPIPSYPSAGSQQGVAFSPAPPAGGMGGIAFSPPPVPSMLTGSSSIDDLVIDSDDEGTALMPPSGTATHPPEFSDLVKKSTRFLTGVPAADVLSKVSGVLEECRQKRIPTPIGLIGDLKIDWNNFRLEVWGEALSGPYLFAMQLYEVPETHSYASSPAHTKLIAMAEAQVASSFGTDRRDSLSASKTLYMVEFVRGGVDIFVFKRFYEWVRQSFSQLVKRDAGTKHLL